MSVDIGRAIEAGGKRTLARNGLYYVAIFWVLGVVSALFSNTVTREMVQDLPGGGPTGTPPVGPTLGVSPAVAGVLLLVLSLLSLVVGAAAIRTFVTGETRTIPGEHFTRNLLWMLINLVVGGIVFGIAVAIGLVFLIVPGIFLLVSLFFWNVYVVEEDQTFIEAFQNSWALTSGDRIMLFVLGFVVLVIAFVVSGLFGVVGGVLPGIIGLAIGQIGSAFVSVFGVATAARTYVQLTEDEAAVPAE